MIENVKALLNIHQQITEISPMLIRMGLILSHDLCVWQNMAGNLQWNFHFINYRHGRFTQN